MGVLSADELGDGVVSGVGDEGLPLVEPGPPIELVLPLGAGVEVDELEDEVVGAGPWSRFVQAPRETAATNANAAHVREDAFIGKLLG